MLGFILSGLLGVPFEGEAHPDNLSEMGMVCTAPNGSATDLRRYSSELAMSAVSRRMD